MRGDLGFKIPSRFLVGPYVVFRVDAMELTQAFFNVLYFSVMIDTDADLHDVAWMIVIEDRRSQGRKKRQDAGTDSQQIHARTETKTDRAGSENACGCRQTFDPSSTLKDDACTQKRDTGYDACRNTRSVDLFRIEKIRISK